MSKRSLEGRVALLTGGGRGLGRAIALAYAKEGAKVAISSRTQSEIDKTLEMISESGGVGFGLAADLTKEEEAKELIDGIDSEFGQLDLVFLNAGGNAAKASIENVDTSAWINTVEINLYTAFHVAKAALPLLKKSANGQILTMGSGMGRRPDLTSSAYSAAKAGLWSLTQSMAIEFAQFGITVNEMIPGPVKANIPKGETFEPYIVNEGAWENEWFKGAEDVVPMAVFLATQHKFGPSGQSFALNRRLL
jgi:3-oxoacyl-[acyl-carrier protein] reductase